MARFLPVALLALLALLLPGRVGAGPLSEVILFASNPDRDSQIYTVRPDGRDMRRLVRLRGECREPNLCSKTGRVAFSVLESGSWHLYLVDLDGRNLSRLTRTHADDRHPSWSPDGSRIVFETNRWGADELAVMDADGSNLRRLTFDETVNRFPSWSPRGDRIAFVSWRQGSSDLYTLDPEDPGDPERLTRNPFADVTPAWAPDGSGLVYGSRNHRRGFLAVVRPGEDPRRLTTGTETATYPAWSPDGSQLLFTARAGPSVALYLVSAEGGAPRPFPADPPAAVFDLVWQGCALPW